MKTMPTIYIETSIIISYLRKNLSSQIVTAAHQLITQRFWQYERKNYDLVISQYVIDEAAAGNPTLAAERLAVLEGIPLLPLLEQVIDIAEKIMSIGVLPKKAQVDALHIAVAAYHQIDYLLTWNCKHLANAKMLPQLYTFFTKKTFFCLLFVPQRSF